MRHLNEFKYQKVSGQISVALDDRGSNAALMRDF